MSEKAPPPPKYTSLESENFEAGQWRFKEEEIPFQGFFFRLQRRVNKGSWDAEERWMDAAYFGVYYDHFCCGGSHAGSWFVGSETNDKQIDEFYAKAFEHVHCIWQPTLTTATLASGRWGERPKTMNEAVDTIRNINPRRWRALEAVGFVPQKAWINRKTGDCVITLLRHSPVDGRVFFKDN